MVLTEEQKERIQRNREAALELRRQRLAKEQAEREESVKKETNQESPTKKQKTDASSASSIITASNDEDVELEAFEEGASEYVTKQDAMKLYCLPAGTVEMCSFIEKPNPRNKSWSSMKLYRRSEVRTRARKRFGSLDGLVAERRKREEDRFKKDMESMKTLFR